MRFGTVLFDLDGTVVDSRAMILASFQHATRTVLGREIPEEELLLAVGGTTLPDQMAAFDVERAAELVEVYREHNLPLHDELEACDGMLDVLETLREQGRKLGVVTSKRRRTIERAFDVLALDRFFDVVVGVDDTTRHKPHPEPLLHALEQLASQPSDGAYVGDSPFDIQAAKAAGIYAVAVAWGGIHDRARLEQEEPDVLVARPEELLGVL